MKKIVFISVFIFSLFLMTGCENEKEIVPITMDRIITMTSSSGPNGTIYPCGITQIKFGDSIVYVVKPDTGYRILFVKLNGVQVPLTGDSLKLKNRQENQKIYAGFVSSKPPELPPTPPPPTNFIATTGTCGTNIIWLTWVSSISATKYTITRDDTTSWDVVTDVIVGNGSDGIIVYDYGLAPGSHTYRINASNASGVSSGVFSTADSPSLCK